MFGYYFGKAECGFATDLVKAQFSFSIISVRAKRATGVGQCSNGLNLMKEISLSNGILKSNKNLNSYFLSGLVLPFVEGTQPL